MGIQSVYGPIFYQVMYGLRFEMGVGAPTDERFRIIPTHFEEATHRALCIYQATEPYDILRINVWVDSEHESGILYHLYDDRGLDVVVTDKMTLQPIYQNYHTWLLDYDREAMKKSI